ncbi:amino acid permease [Agrococcus sp. SGAir0287]|uniref:amino acid permease n=1 Tax=Agrococcus sp. SGAir0287 TaxID=2070347 RepID=UPI0010CD664E|nr:amino acid permease [Agrococcus sp. SGAir0287]QCR18161.1 GABA permease [Agrococcus sp. SGAir0287]
MATDPTTDRPLGSRGDAAAVAGGEPLPTKRLRTRHVTMITLGGIIGASLFVGSANIIRETGPAAMLSYLIGGLLVFLAMRMLGEMAAARPAVGSFMEYARVGLGDWAAYVVGWLYWYFWVGVIAYEAVVGGGMVHAWFPAIPAWLASLVLLAIFVTTNLISLRSFGETEFWLASIKVVAIVVFLVAGVLFALGLWPGATMSVGNLWEHGGFMPNGFGVVLTSVALVLFSYFGTEIAVMAAAESEDPAKGIKQAAKTVIWRVMLFYVGAILVIVTVVPWDELPSPDVIAPFSYVFDLFGVPGAETIMQLVIFTAVISVLNSGTYSASRMFAALAEQGLAPRAVAKRSRRGVPVLAVVASTIGGLVATLVNFLAPSSGIYEFIMNSTGLVALFVYVFIAVTQWRLRSRMTAEEREGLQLKVWLFPWLNVVLIAAAIGIVGIMLLSDSGRVQVLTSVIAAGALVLFWPLVRRGLQRRRAAGIPDGERVPVEAAESAAEQR